MTADLAPYIIQYRVSLIFAGIGCVAVPIVYAFVSEGKWRDSALGRHLMGSDAILAVMFLFYISSTFIDLPRVELIIGSVLFIAFGVLRLLRANYMLRARKVREAEQKYGLYKEEASE